MPERVGRADSPPWERKSGRDIKKYPRSFERRGRGSCEKIGIKRYSPPCITAHHCKEGWPSDSENIAKHPLIARPGWFSDESKRKTTPAASASVASPNFL